jgi:hypothetical protein
VSDLVHTDACYRRGDQEILIGQPYCQWDVAEKADRLLDGITVELQTWTTEELEEIAAYRESINAEGWMARLIREYVEVWR